MQVSWDGPQDPQNPKNWSFKRKWAATVTASSFALLAPVCSSMLAPALGLVKKDFNIPSEAETVLTMTNYNFALAIGPLFLGPLSEIYGRVPILQFSALFFLVFNSAAGWATNKGQFIAFRFISGLGGSAPLAVSQSFTKRKSGHDLTVGRFRAASSAICSSLSSVGKQSGYTLPRHC